MKTFVTLDPPQDLKKKPCKNGKKLVPKDVGDFGVNVEVFDVQVKVFRLVLA